MPEEIQWRKMTLTQIGPRTYKCELESETEEGEGELEIEENADWITVAKSMRDEYHCDVYVNFPNNDPPRICFYVGDKPWKREDETCDSTI